MTNLTNEAEQFLRGFLAATGLSKEQVHGRWGAYLGPYPDFESGYEAGLEYLADCEERDRAKVDAEFRRELRDVGWDVMD